LSIIVPWRICRVCDASSLLPTLRPYYRSGDVKQEESNLLWAIMSAQEILWT
jgi:hypothetical protein